LVFAAIIKSLFFSDSYITSRLQHFKKVLRQNESVTTISHIDDESTVDDDVEINTFVSNNSQVVDKAENIPLIDEEDSNDFEQLTPEE
jgi:hypothetical protein